MTSDFLPPTLPFSADDLDVIAHAVPYSSDVALQRATELRGAGYSPEQASALLNQAKFRTQAATKFGSRAQHLLFTEAGLEQATRAPVAQLHATRFVEAGIVSVADLGCGIGADSLAFAEAGLGVAAVELDSATVAFTAFNLREYPAAKVYCADLKELSLHGLSDGGGTQVQGLWLDPARRTLEGAHTQSRIFDPEAFMPPLSFVRALAATGIPMGVKMGPGIPHEEIPEGCEAQWVSHGGSVVEVVLWFNALAHPGIRRSATVLSNHLESPQILADFTSEVPDENQEPVPTGELEKYLFEPDGAVVRSHLIGEIAKRLGAHALDEHIAYLTAPVYSPTPGAQAFEVKGTMPVNEKILKRWAREENIGTLTIKKRGVDIVPEQLRLKILGSSKKKRGSESATLIITRIGEGTTSQRIAIHAKPLPSALLD